MSFSFSKVIEKPSHIITVENKIVPLKLPKTKGVYVLLDEKGEVLYTGKSNNIRVRFYNHLSNCHNKKLKKEIESENIKKILIYECETMLDVNFLEKYLIQSGISRGKYNIEYTDKIIDIKLKTYFDEVNGVF
ncbi:GIY-YIG nuclease family protein [Priestia filamentosa]|uniref:GIY-YIG nuclease family protein n=1 Tax=Priestia filamentosa TaxID=1402861 RepID=UPI003981ACE9